MALLKGERMDGAVMDFLTSNIIACFLSNKYNTAKLKSEVQTAVVSDTSLRYNH